MTKDEVADAVRKWCAAWHARDVKTIIAMEARAGGFGFRPRARRDHAALGESAYGRRIEQFFDRLEYYRLEIQELETAVEGNVGLAWGVYIEEFQEKERPPERARVRFSKVLSRGAKGWEVVLYHRDIQPFDSGGNYPRTLTAIPNP